ncbi:MAG: choice-of-anchor D domain-containing protein, partial [Verrucomicrobiota bacterium]
KSSFAACPIPATKCREYPNLSGWDPINGGDWTPWVTFNNGAFVTYLTLARNAAQSIDSTVVRGINDTVSATASLKVRPSAGSATITRTVSAGATGTVIGGYTVSAITGGSTYRFIWWNIHWNDGGADGWSAEDYMVRTTVLQPNMSLNYNGTAIPNGDTSPTAAKGTDFGTVNYGFESAHRSFTIRNDGAAPLNLTGTIRVQIGGNNASDFLYYAPAPSTPVGANGGSTTFILAFEPTVNTGLRTATVTIPNNDPNKNPYTFTVQGTADFQHRVDPELEYNGVVSLDDDLTPSVSAGTDFGSVNVGSQSATHSFRFYNYGTVNMTLTGSMVQLSGASSGDFAIVSMPSSPIAPNQYSTIGIRFQPTASGLRTASMLIYYDDTYGLGATSPYTVGLQGTGTVTPGSLQVNLAPAGAISAGAQWQVDGGAWQSSGATVSGLSVGSSHTLAFNTVSGWTTPGSQTPTITANQTTTTTGTYVVVTTPTMTSPTPGSTLNSSSAMFQWSSGTGVSEYFFYVGTTPGGGDIYGQSQGLNLSATVSGLPVDGSPLYVALWWSTSGGWQSTNATYTAWTRPSGPNLSGYKQGGNMVLSWPTNATGYSLQSATSLGTAAVWGTVSPPPVVVGGQNVVTTLVSGPRRFFRLMHP